MIWETYRKRANQLNIHLEELRPQLRPIAAEEIKLAYFSFDPAAGLKKVLQHHKKVSWTVRKLITFWTNLIFINNPTLPLFIVCLVAVALFGDLVNG